MEWADATVWKATPLSGQPDTRLRELLVHIHVVQRAFFSAWTSRPVTDAFKRAEEFETLGAVRSWAQPLYEEMATFVQGLTAREPYGADESAVGADDRRPPGVDSTCDDAGGYLLSGHEPHHLSPRASQHSIEGNRRRATTRGLHRLGMVRQTRR